MLILEKTQTKNVIYHLDHNGVENDYSSCDTPLLIKEGQMKKCKMGGKLTNVQWKKYNFTLFNDSIHYSKKYDSQVSYECMIFVLVIISD